MLLTTMLRKGAGPLSLTLGGLVLTGGLARGEDGPSLSRQLTDLGRQAMAQGQADLAKSFFKKAVELDPADREARKALEVEAVRQVAMQDPASPAVGNATIVATPPLAPVPGVDAAPAGGRQATATLEESARLENVYRQQLGDDVGQRLQQARDQLAAGNPEASISTLRLLQNMIRSADQVDETTKKQLDQRVQAQLLSTVRREESVVAERAERMRMSAASEQQSRTLDLLARNESTVSAMMTQFDSLMSQGIYNVLYNGGSGDITAATAPFSEARMLAQQARALVPNDPTPLAGMFVAQTMGFLAQELAFEQLKEYRFMLTMQDVARANVPFPDGKVIEYPDADRWRRLSERRIERYGKAVDLLDRDPKTKSILAKLNEPVSMNFKNETPLEDVLNYIKNATQGPNDSGIPIYVDPVGLQEAEKTMTSPVTLDLEGVPLKTTLRLLLKQLGLTFTVKDGMLTITSESSEDQPTEIRVYPVADLSIIPFSLMGGGGGGGMGGGMGGGGMGGGGMGGGMGGGGMGGGGMGGGGMGGGGMMSMPVQDPAESSTFTEKKSN